MTVTYVCLQYVLQEDCSGARDDLRKMLRAAGKLNLEPCPTAASQVSRKG